MKLRGIVLVFIVCILIPLVCNAQPASNMKSSIKVLVVVYSYTGNTKAVADEIVKRFDADVVRITARKYEESGGSIYASIDAWTEVRTTEISPATIDMRGYDLVFLGSPIWWYRPAVPLWSFVEKNDFGETKVVLFNTFNSKFKDKYIERFEKLLEEKGGQMIDHLYVRRGRWYEQMGREELLEEFSRLLDRKGEEYIRALLRTGRSH